MHLHYEVAIYHCDWRCYSNNVLNIWLLLQVLVYIWSHVTTWSITVTKHLVVERYSYQTFGCGALQLSNIWLCLWWLACIWSPVMAWGVTVVILWLMMMMMWSLMSSDVGLTSLLGTNCDQCVCMAQCCFTSTETIGLIRTGSPGRPPRLSHSSWTLTLGLL